jgi:hypothetical protein
MTMNSGSQNGMIQRMAMEKLAENLEAAGRTLRESVGEKRGDQWTEKNKAKSAAKSAEENGNGNQVLNEAFFDVQKRYAESAMALVQAEQDPEQGIPALKQSMMDLFVALHNPELQEALLLAVKEEHRDDVRKRFQEFGRLFWGIIDMNAGNNSDDFFYLLDVLSTQSDMTLEDVAENVDGISYEDIPGEYR